MKIIKHLNIEYDRGNFFSFDSKIFELTKSYNLELLVSLFNDIGYDLFDKLELMLDNHNIEFFRNDVNIELNNIIYFDLFENFSNGKGFDYVSNEKYTFEEFLKHIKHSQSSIFEFRFFYFDIHNKLRRDYHTIRYETNKETEEIKDLREYFESVLMHIAGIIEKEYDKIKIDDNEDQFEPLDLSGNTTQETKEVFINDGYHSISTPQNNIDVFLCNDLNIEIFESAECRLPDFEISTLEYFNLLFSEFNFFVESINDYLKIKEHFIIPDFNTISKDDKEINFKNYLNYHLRQLIKYHFPIDERKGVVKKCCERFDLVDRLISNFLFGYDPVDNQSVFETIKESVEELEPKEQLSQLINAKFEILQNPNYYTESKNELKSFTENINFEIERIENLLKIELTPKLNQTQPKQIKQNKSLLFDGKELNLSERFKIANKVLDIDHKIRTLNIPDLEKYQLLAYILGCDKDNARNIMNGTYNSKVRDLTPYFDTLNLKK